jgi:hypothetical protein
VIKTKNLEFLFLTILILIIIFILFLSNLKETPEKAKFDTKTFIDDKKMNTFVVLEKDYRLTTYFIQEKEPVQFFISIRTTKGYRDKFYEYYDRIKARRNGTFMG